MKLMVPNELISFALELGLEPQTFLEELLVENVSEVFLRRVRQEIGDGRPDGISLN